MLRTGLEAWVWFKNCEKPAKKTPLAATIWIFSTDPDDVNPEWNSGIEYWPSPAFVRKCIFPEPGGGNADMASLANIHGKIIKKTASTITIKEKGKAKKTLVKFNEKTGLHIAFNKDDTLDELRPGQEAWIWFENCKKPAGKTPLAMTIWVFSADPDKVNPDWDTNTENWPSPSAE